MHTFHATNSEETTMDEIPHKTAILSPGCMEIFDIDDFID